MRDRVNLQACLFGGLLCSLASVSAWGLDVGFFGHISIKASDNVEGANNPDEQDGTIQSGVLGVYGQQDGRRLNAAFSGELDTRKVVSSDSSDINSITRFLGAAEFKITPRSWRWYVGDILGGVRNDSGILPVDNDDSQIVRRNVFVTGPSFEYDIVGISRTRARLLYVNQTESNNTINQTRPSGDLETLVTANFSYERDTTPGSYYGFRAGNILTDLPRETLQDGEATAQNAIANPDFNRSTFGLYYNRKVAFTELYGELGVTRYDADDESLNGLNAQLRATQALGPGSQASVSIGRDLSDQSLNAVESLIENGDSSLGLQRASGFFAETRLVAEYRLQQRFSVLDMSAGLADIDYQLLSGSAQTAADGDSEDRHLFFAAVAWSQRLSNRFRTELGINIESQDFENRPDNTDSILANVQLIYALSPSFDLSFGLTHNQSDGLRTRFDTEGVPNEEPIDITENRASISLRWAPPSRADQGLIVELKSLLR